MLPKCMVLLLVAVAVKSATLQGRNIPVEVRYERLDHDVNLNLDEKTQLSGEEIKENNLRLEKLSIAEEDLIPTNNNQNFIRNFDEKVQLSPEELLQSSKHIPISYGIQENEHTDKWETLGELRGNPLPETKPEATYSATFIQQAQDIVEKGLKNLRKNFIPKENEISPSIQDWEKLESTVREYFAEETNKLGSRQNPVNQPQNIFQNIANGIQQVTNNFVQQFQQNGPNSTVGDEGQAPQQQGPFQGFVGYFTGGVQNIVSSIQNISQVGQQGSGNSTVLGDTGTGGNQQPGNFIGNIVNNVQQLFQGQIPGSNQGVSGNGTQGDTPSGGGGAQQGFFAGAISQFNQVVSNIIPTSSQAPPAVQGDEGAGSSPAPNPPGGPIQQVVQSFGSIGTNLYNQFTQGGQPQTKPPGSEDESNQPPNQNFVQSIGQNIGNAIQSIQNQFRPPSIPGSSAQAPAPAEGNSNPIVGQVTNVGNQIQQVAASNPITNLIPGGTSTSSKQPAEERLEEAPSNVAIESTIDTTESTVDKTKDSEKKEEVTTASE